MPNMSEYATKTDLYNSTMGLKETIEETVKENESSKIVDVFKNYDDFINSDASKNPSDKDIVKVVKDDDDVTRYVQYHDNEIVSTGRQMAINGGPSNGGKIISIRGNSRSSYEFPTPTDPITISNNNLSSFKVSIAGPNPLKPIRINNTSVYFPNFIKCEPFNQPANHLNIHHFYIVRGDGQSFASGNTVGFANDGGSSVNIAGTINGSRIEVNFDDNYPEDYTEYDYFKIDLGTSASQVESMNLYIDYPLDANNDREYSYVEPEFNEISINLNYTLEGLKDYYDEIQYVSHYYDGWTEKHWYYWKRMERKVLNSTNFAFMDVEQITTPVGPVNALKVSYNATQTEYSLKVADSNYKNFACTHYMQAENNNISHMSSNCFYVPNGQVNVMYFGLPSNITTLEDATTYINGLGATLVFPLEYSVREEIEGETFDLLDDMEFPSEEDNYNEVYGFVWNNADALLVEKSNPFWLIKVEEGPYATQEEIGDIQTLLDNLDIGEGV